MSLSHCCCVSAVVAPPRNRGSASRARSNLYRIDGHPFNQMKARQSKKASASLRHEPMKGKGGKVDRASFKSSPSESSKVAFKAKKEADEDSDGEEERNLPLHISSNILKDARSMLEEQDDNDSDEGESIDDEEEEEEVDEEYVYNDGDDLQGGSRGELDANEEELINRFLHADKAQTRTLADIIMDKLREKEELEVQRQAPSSDSTSIPPKVVEVYTSVGSLLQHYKSGKLPKALKMLPHLKNWEQILWITRPDMWSPIATYAVTRIFVSNLKVKMAQRFFNLVLLEKCRDDINRHDKLNYHLYLAVKKALFKPAAFYKGILLPLAQSGTCTLREATIFASVLMKVSIPAIHSAAALLRLAEMPYSGSTSVFIRTLLLKKYALPGRVLDALVQHFSSFLSERRQLPVIWHQSLLIFVQRYKMEFSEAHNEAIMHLIRQQSHHEITPEIRRELAMAAKQRSS